MPLIHRIISLFLTMLFALFAAFQWNDPDPWVWIAIYLIPAAVCFRAFRGRIIFWLCLLLNAFFLGGAIWWFPTEWNGLSLADGYRPSIEEARESLGLGVCAVAMIYLALVEKFRKKVPVAGA